MASEKLVKQIKEMSYDEKLEIFLFLKKDLGFLDEEWTHIAGVEAGIKMMEYLEQNVKTKV